MHVSVCENCRIQSTSIWYRNHQDILHVIKVMTSYIQEPQLKILLGAQGFPTTSWLHNDLFLPQMCPALNSNPYRSNKQVVPLLGCCSDAPGSPGNRLVILGDWTFSNSIFGSNPSSKSSWKKLLHFGNTLWPKIRLFDASFLSGLCMFSARLPCQSDSANFFPQKTLSLTENYRFFFFFKSGSNFCSATPLHICNASFWYQNTQTDAVMMCYLSTIAEHAWTSVLSTMG